MSRERASLVALLRLLPSPLGDGLDAMITVVCGLRARRSVSGR